jgi:hypothetical protein
MREFTSGDESAEGGPGVGEEGSALTFLQGHFGSFINGYEDEDVNDAPGT